MIKNLFYSNFKPPPFGGGFGSRRFGAGELNNVYHFRAPAAAVKAFFVFGREFDRSFGRGVKRVVVAPADVFSGEEFRAALAHQNAARSDFLAVKQFDA